LNTYLAQPSILQFCNLFTAYNLSLLHLTKHYTTHVSSRAVHQRLNVIASYLITKETCSSCIM